MTLDQSMDSGFQIFLFQCVPNILVDNLYSSPPKLPSQFPTTDINKFSSNPQTVRTA